MESKRFSGTLGMCSEETLDSWSRSQKSLRRFTLDFDDLGQVGLMTFEIFEVS